MTRVAVAGVLVVLAIGVSLVRRLGLERELVVATVRALIQLLLVASIITFVFDHFGVSAIVLPAMLVVAAWTSARRIRGVPRGFWVAAISIAAGAGVGVVVLFGGRVFDLEPRFLIPIAGMLIGNCMTATSVAGMRLRDDLTERTLEVEARLALGIPVGEALRSYVRRATVTSLIPTIDATKNVGVILLPGAFVGMVLGGESPLRAAEVQLIVLFMLLGAVAIAGMVATTLVGRAFIGRGDRIVLPRLSTG